MKPKSRPYPTGRKAIRKAMRAQHNDGHSWDLIGASWGISGGMAWKIAKEKGYWPQDKEIEMRILKEASGRGIPLGNKGGRDLWSMTKEELIWRLLNREG